MTRLWYLVHCADQKFDNGVCTYSLAVWIIIAPTQVDAEEHSVNLVRNLYWNTNEYGEEIILPTTLMAATIDGSRLDELLVAWEYVDDKGTPMLYQSVFSDQILQDEVFEAEPMDFDWMPELVNELMLKKLSA